jgi:hypothetical protein
MNQLAGRWFRSQSRADLCFMQHCNLRREAGSW